jgi:hypothetical protein
METATHYPIDRQALQEQFINDPIRRQCFAQLMEIEEATPIESIFIPEDGSPCQAIKSYPALYYKIERMLKEYEEREYGDMLPLKSNILELSQE